MRFLSVELHNFQSYGDTPTIINLAKRGLVGVVGSNGNGKSTAFADSIVWCLFGKTTKGLSGVDVVNNINNNTCYVKLVLEDDSGVIYTITRTQGNLKSKKSNDLLIESNGKDITKGIKNDTQQLVNTIIGMNINTFMQSVLLISKGKPFCLMTDSEKKEVLEDILYLNKLSFAVDKIKLLTKQGQIDLAKIDADLDIVKSRLLFVEANLNKLNQLNNNYSNELDSKKSDLIKQKESIIIEIDKIKNSVEQNGLIKELHDIRNELIDLAKEETILTSKSLEVLKKIRSDKGINQQQLAVVENKINELNNSFENINKLTGASCPTCTQLVSPQFADSVFSQIDFIIKDYRIAKATLEDIIGKLEDKEEEFINDVNSKIKEISDQKELLNNNQEIIKNKINKIELDRQKLHQLERQLSFIESEISSIFMQPNPYIELIKQSSEEYRIYKDNIKVLTDKKYELEKQLSLLSYWQVGFGNKGLKSYIIDSVIPFLTERTQYYADILTDGDYKISFDTQKQLKSGDVEEDFHVNVINKRGSHIYKGNSDGEKQRINIAVSWAIGDLAASRALKPIKFRVLDEAQENMDEDGEEALLRLLNTVTPHYESIFLISHKNSLQDRLPSEIKVVKNKEFSTILEN